MEDFLYKRLGLNLNKKQVISIVGGGGKTTTIFSLANELKSLDKKILITTTTNIFVPEKESYDNFFLKDIGVNKVRASTITILGEKIVEGKLKGLDKLSLEKLMGNDLFDFYLIEADGARRKPIKAPDTYEPIIIDSTTITLGVIGLDALFKNIVETSHRSHLLINLLKKAPTDAIKSEDIINLVLHENGLFKDYKGKRVLLLNKAINEIRINEAIVIREELSKRNFENVIISDVISKQFY